jgi:hypothetical protein
LNSPNTTVADLLRGNSDGDAAVCPQNHADAGYKPPCSYAGSNQANAYFYCLPGLDWSEVISVEDFMTA